MNQNDAKGKKGTYTCSKCLYKLVTNLYKLEDLICFGYYISMVSMKTRINVEALC